MSFHHTSSDRELVDAIRVNDQQAEPAFRILYDRYGKRLYAYGLKVLRTESRASDIVQDTFLRLLTSIRRGDQIENVPAYLLRITRNLCLNARRDEHLSYMDPEHIDLIDEHRELPEDADMRQHVLRALDRLPDVYREAIVLQMYSGLSYAEICDVTGESLPTIRHRISRAKQRLRTYLLPLIIEQGGPL
jgi:RNA polymerase sigma-70 factor (ECF subfamily)